VLGCLPGTNHRQLGDYAVVDVTVRREKALDFSGCYSRRELVRSIR
jgi:hypothetical protein